MFTIMGITHMQGTSKKTGNPYNFYNCHLLNSDPPRGGEGRAVLEFNLRGDLPDADKLRVGMKIDLLYGGGFVIRG